MAVVAAGSFGIAGAVVGAAVTHVLERRARRDDEQRRWELRRLADAEIHLKRLSAGISAHLVLPNLFTAYRTISTLRDLMYLNPTGLDSAAVDEILAVLNDAVFRRSRMDTLRRWFLGDTRKEQALVERLVGAETALAASIDARRQEIISGRARSSA